MIAKSTANPPGESGGGNPASWNDFGTRWASLSVIGAERGARSFRIYRSPSTRLVPGFPGGSRSTGPELAPVLERVLDRPLERDGRRVSQAPEPGDVGADVGLIGRPEKGRVGFEGERDPGKTDQRLRDRPHGEALPGSDVERLARVAPLEDDPDRPHDVAHVRDIAPDLEVADPKPPGLALSLELGHPLGEVVQDVPGLSGPGGDEEPPAHDAEIEVERVLQR